MADAGGVSPGPVLGTDYGAAFWAPTGILLAVAAVVSAARLYPRTRPVWRWTSDDYTLALALVLLLGLVICEIVVYAHGRGVEGAVMIPSVDVPWNIAAGFLYLWGLNVVRISVSLWLLPLGISAWWRLPLWTIIVVNIGLIIVATTINSLVCRPLSALWEPVPGAVCLGWDQLVMYGKSYTSVNLVSNFVLSVIPLTFLHMIRRHWAEKLAIASLMAVGFGATALEIVRLAWILDAHEAVADSAWGRVRYDITCVLELLIGIIAASLPRIKAPVHHALYRLGLLSTAPTSHATPNLVAVRLTNTDRSSWQMGRYSSPTPQTTIKANATE